MWHVLEHIPKLEETVKNLKQILSNEGIVIVAVPNKDSWDAKYYGKFWAAWDVPIHLWHFSQKSIVSLFNKHGFSLIKQKGMIFDSFYVSLLSEQYKFGKKAFLRSFLIGIRSNFHALISKNGHSSMIYVFKNTK